LKKGKKRKLKRLYWLLAHLALALVIFALLLYKPGRYDPTKIAPGGGKRVSRYLTHELSPKLYNGAQLGEPFDLVVTQKGMNDIVARWGWPKESDGATFSAPAVLFVPDSIVLMGTAILKGVEFVVTVVLEASFDEEGLLNLRVAKVKIGAMNITILARIAARRMYQQQAALVPIDTEDLGAQIAASLLSDQPFDPVLKVKDTRVRVEKMTIEHEKLILHLIPLAE